MIYTGFLLFGAFLNLFISLFTLSRGAKDKAKKTFCYWTMSTTIWFIMDFGLSISPNPGFALKWAQIMLIGVIFISSTFFHFVVSFLKEKGEKRYIFVCVGYIISLIFTLLSISGLLISNVIPFKTGGYFPQFTNNLLPIIFLLFFYVYTLAGIFLLIRRYKRSVSPLEKNQLKYILVGLLIAIGGGISNFYLAMGKEKVFPIGNLTELAFVGMTAIAIVKYKLMDIDVILAPGIVYGTLTALITAFWLCSIFIFERVFHIVSFPIRLLALFVIIFVFNVLKERIQYVVDRLFFRERQELSKATSKIAKEITSILDPDIIATSCMKEIYDTCHPTFISLMLLSNNGKFYEIKSLIGEGEMEVFFPINDPLIELLKRERKGVFKEENVRGRKLRVVFEGMEKIKTRFTIPLFFGDNLVGLLNLGEKKIGSYTLAEIDFLETIGRELGIALENTKLYDELKKKAIELEKANQAKIDFLHVVSHELNTPLTIIIGQVYLLEKEFKKKKIDFSSHMEIIKRRGKELTLLIKDMLDVASIEKGEKKELKKEVINVFKIIKDTAESFSLMALNKGLEIEIAIEGEISLISDKKILENILFRLLDNAIKFTPSGGFITIGAKKTNDEVLFFVKDTGIGIKEEDKEKIFERFFQADSSSTRKYGGAGLGLAIVKEMVTALSGKIWVEGEPGKGSKFCFTIKKNY